MSDLLSRAAESFPDSVFIFDGDETVTFAEAERLVASRQPPRWGVVAPTLNAGSIIGLLAAVRSGGAVVVGPSSPKALIEERLASLGGGSASTIVFTSGSTGHAKGVRLTDENWEAAGTNSAGFYGFGPGDRWLLALPLYHVGGLSIIFRALCSGGAVVVSTNLGLIGEVEFCSLVPTQLGRLFDAGVAVPKAKALLVGGGPLPSGFEARARGWPVVRTYGMTETAAVVASASPGDGLGPMRPIPGVEFRRNADGRLEVRGAQVSPGYLGERPRSRGDWFVTADRGLVHDDGRIEVMGRADRAINTGGVKVDPGAVEIALRSVAEVGEVAVLGVPDTEWGEVVAVLFTGSIEPDALKAAVRKTLGAEAVPRKLLRVESLPQTELGKIDYLRAGELFG